MYIILFTLDSSPYKIGIKLAQHTILKFQTIFCLHREWRILRCWKSLSDRNTRILRLRLLYLVSKESQSIAQLPNMSS